MKMEIDVFCILQNIVYGYFLPKIRKQSQLQ